MGIAAPGADAQYMTVSIGMNTDWVAFWALLAFFAWAALLACAVALLENRARRKRLRSPGVTMGPDDAPTGTKTRRKARRT